MKLDWVDIGLHALAAFCFMASAALLFEHKYVLVAAVINSAFWLCRELYQHGWKFGGAQSQVEWIAPSAVGCLIVNLF
jgi:hypothetical protein